MKENWYVILQIAILILLAINIVLMVKMNKPPAVHIHVNDVEEREERK